jgi:hypothetical protein
LSDTPIAGLVSGLLFQINASIMKTINKIQILMIAIFCSGFATSDGTWIIARESTLAIHGATNINKFTCSINSYSGHDTLQYDSNISSSELQFTTNGMTIPIQKFDCGTKQISRDFQSTLKSDLFPDLNIRFVSLERGTLKSEQFVNGKVKITLAGVTKQYTIRFKTIVEKHEVVLSGSHPVNFTDFKLTAPEKLNGLIRVKDGLRVEFHLVLKSL